MGVLERFKKKAEDLAKHAKPKMEEIRDKTKPKVEDDHVGLGRCKLPHRLLPLRGRDDPHIVLLQVVHDHMLH